MRFAGVGAAVRAFLFSRYRNALAADRMRHLEESVGRLGAGRVVLIAGERARLFDIADVDDRVDILDGLGALENPVVAEPETALF